MKSLLLSMILACCLSDGSDAIEFNRLDDCSRQGENGYNPALTHGAAWIAYETFYLGPPYYDRLQFERSGNLDLWIIYAGGGTRVRVTGDKPGAGSPSWSPDGSILAFSSGDEHSVSVWLATNIPDWTTTVEERHWGQIKELYR